MIKHQFFHIAMHCRRAMLPIVVKVLALAAARPGRQTIEAPQLHGAWAAVCHLCCSRELSAGPFSSARVDLHAAQHLVLRDRTIITHLRHVPLAAAAGAAAKSGGDSGGGGGGGDIGGDIGGGGSSSSERRPGGGPWRGGVLRQHAGASFRVSRRTYAAVAARAWR